MSYVYPHADAENPFKIEPGLASERSAQTRSGVTLPASFQVISADCHWEITEDIFYDNFPPSLRDRAPRVWFDEFWHIGYRDGEQAWEIADRHHKLLARVNAVKGFDVNLRYSDLEAEGIRSEIVFPHSLLGMLRFKDLEVREQIFRTYNEYVAKRTAESRGRSYGVGIFANWWDPARAEESMQQLIDLELKTFMVPILLKDLNGKEVSFSAKEMERFWSVVESGGLPLDFHIGEDSVLEGPPGAFATAAMHSFSCFRRPLSQLVFGRVFDRHPKLRIVFTEGGINWVPAFLQDAELMYGTFGSAADEKPKHNPTHYWRTHCYSTFQRDKIGLEMLRYIGADRVMWGSDYPHSEGCFGASWSAMNEVIKHTSEEDARKILGDTARRVYRL